VALPCSAPGSQGGSQRPSTTFGTRWQTLSPQGTGPGLIAVVKTLASPLTAPHSLNPRLGKSPCPRPGSRTHPNDAVQLPHGHLLGPLHGLQDLLLVLGRKSIARSHCAPGRGNTGPSIALATRGCTARSPLPPAQVQRFHRITE